MSSIYSSIRMWFDNDIASDSHSENFNWFRCLPFVLLHISCLGVIWTGWSPFAVYFCIGFFFLRMFSITAFYHRYFSHRSFKTSRTAQFIFAVLGNMAVQRGPLWWAGHHRHHHQHSDTESDLHSPVKRGFWWSHMGWFTCDASFKTPIQRIEDFAKFPELRFLNRYDSLVPLLTGFSLFVLGELLKHTSPQLGTSGVQLLVWGFFISTVLLFHSTVTINSLAHIWGKKRFETEDNSRNNAFLAVITLGEGWHNNHHRYPRAAKHGFTAYEIDITYMLLWVMNKLGLVWDLTPLPQRIKAEIK